MKWKIWLMHLDIMRVKMVYNVGKHSSRLSDELDMSLTAVQLLLNTLGGQETKTLEQKLKILEKRLGTYSKPPRY